MTLMISWKEHVQNNKRPITSIARSKGDILLLLGTTMTLLDWSIGSLCPVASAFFIACILLSIYFRMCIRNVKWSDLRRLTQYKKFDFVSKSIALTAFNWTDNTASGHSEVSGTILTAKFLCAYIMKLFGAENQKNCMTL